MKKLTLLLCMLLITLCPLAIAQEVEVNPLSAWADNLYEPETKVALPATIVWPADADAQTVAQADVRPNTMLVKVDADLSVTTLDGETISEDLESFLLSVKQNVLPALYVGDAQTAEVLSAFCSEHQVKDVFVAASSKNAELVKVVTDANSGVLGIVDFTDAELDASRESLHGIVTTTNASHARIAIIPQTISDRQSVDYLRGMLATVWVKTEADVKSIYTQLTNGVNGVVCSDYESVASALEFLGGETTLLRQTFMAGHRGMPSKYIENTIRSERAAIDAGANVIECDVLMSSDGEIFILHDEDAKRLFDREDITEIQALTMDEILALEFDVTDDTKENAPNSVLNANNENRTKDRRADMVIDIDLTVDKIPTLREYLTELDDESVIHFIEIKTNNPAIVAPLKAVCEEMGVTDRMVIITFNDGYVTNEAGERVYDETKDVMAEMQRIWPEMSLGYLGYDGVSCPDLTGIIEANSGKTGEAVGALMETLQPYNSTYNQYNNRMSREVISAGRHRGLTCWPWTYNTEELFASDYLFGIYSLTTNYTWWATELPVEIRVQDVVLNKGETAACGTVIAQDGSELDAGAMTLVQLDGVPVELDANGNLTGAQAGEALVMLKLNAQLDIDGFDLSSIGDTGYALYSNPFTVMVAE